MKKLVFMVVMVVVVCLAVPAIATVIEDFESGTIGNTLVAEGWTEFNQDSPPTARWTVQAPSGTGNDSLKVAMGYGYGYAQVAKLFSSGSGITAASTDVFISAMIRPVLDPWDGAEPTRVGARVGTAGNIVGPLVDFEGTANYGEYVFAIRDGASVVKKSSQIATIGDWYELRLQIAVDTANIGNSTGTLYYRDLTLGQTAFTAISDLTNLNLGLTADKAPALWDTWFMDGVYSATRVDNLQVGAGPIPEPATMLLLGLGALALRRNRK